MTTSERIKKARKAKGITQQELADKLGYKSRSSVNKLEKEARDIPRSQIVKLAEILDVTPAYLMGWDEFDGKFNTNRLSQEAKLYDDIKKLYGSETVEAVNLFTQLDDTDKGKIIGRMETMLENEKYQKGLDEKAI